MNARQAARAAAKRIEELEYVNRLNASDIRLYNRCIDHMIAHGSPCDYCEDLADCRAAEKDVSIGCDEWMLNSSLTLPDVNKEESGIRIEGSGESAGESISATGSGS